MPVIRFQEKTFIRCIQLKYFLLLTIIVIYRTRSFDAYCSLNGLMMSVATSLGIIYTIYIKDPLYSKWYDFFDHGQVSPVICKGLEIDDSCHRYKSI